MALTSKEQKLLDFIASRQSSLPQAISLVRMRYTGLVGGSDVYVADAMSRDHPFAKAMEGHKYLERLSDLGGFTLTMTQSGDAVSTTDVDYPGYAPAPTSTVSFPTLAAYTEVVTGKANFTYNVVYPRTPAAVPGGDWTVAATQTAEGIHLVIPAQLSYGKEQFIGPTWIDMTKNSVMLPPLGTFTLGSFIDSTAPFSSWVKEAANKLPSGPLDLSEMSIDMGVHSLQLGSLAAVKIPRYAGYSTHVFMQPCFEPWVNPNVYAPICVWRALVFYKFGARKDTCVVGGIYHKGEGFPQTHHNEYFEFDPKLKPAGTIAQIAGMTQTRLFPMSGCPFFVNNYYGVAKPMVEVETLMYDSRMVVKIIEQDVNVTAVRGKLTYNELTNYFGHGYELFTPITGDDLTKTLDSWAPYVETGLVFGIQPGDASGYSLKTLPFYAEYARIRKKACRDNDFMQKMYDSKYTNKQVESMLESAGRIDVWCTNAAFSSTERKDVTWSRTVLQATKTSFNGVEVYAVQFPGELNSRKYPFNVEGAQQLLTEVIEADFGLKDNTGTLDSILGASDDGDVLSNTNTGSITSKVSEFDMRMTSYNLGSAILAKDLENQAGRVAATAYVAQQFTLFRHVRVNIPYLISEFFFDKVWGSRIAK